ncbi:MAG: erythromycin biosynthesis sensory transduction protein eryC1 [Chlorobiaceae bacterium]|nr:erythromycin biosynthesis sensory transduction protein eryC1 [Chlorobiaceae bacterium]
MNIPLADLKKQYQSIKPEIDSAIQNVIENTQFILGKAVTDFEQEFAKAHHVKHCIAVGSGTDALHAALWALDIGLGDAVITTPFTFIATVEAISLTGAQPLFVDIEPKTYTMDPVKLEELLKSPQGKNVKAILPIHLYGQPAAMDEIQKIALKYNVKIIEDAAQSHLAMYDGKFVGNFGEAACFSFYPGKNLGAYGEAGGIITNDDAFAKKLRQLRDHGQSEKYKHQFWGHNYRMDGIQGAVLGVKLKYLAQWTAKRREIAAKYKQTFNGIGDLILPYESPKAVHVYHQFVLRTKKRAAFQQYLTDKEIGNALHYPIPIHFQEAYKHLGYKPGDFPVSEACAEECISIPAHPEMTEEMVNYVIEEVCSFYKS